MSLASSKGDILINIRERLDQEKAEAEWQTCLDRYAMETCNINKDAPQHRKTCSEVKKCVMKGFDEPLTTNVLDALGVSVKESAGIATALALLGMYFFR